MINNLYDSLSLILQKYVLYVPGNGARLSCYCETRLISGMMFFLQAFGHITYLVSQMSWSNGHSYIFLSRPLNFDSMPFILRLALLTSAHLSHGFIVLLLTLIFL